MGGPGGWGWWGVPALSVAGGSEALRGIFGIAVIGRRPPGSKPCVPTVPPPPSFYTPPLYQKGERKTKKQNSRTTPKAPCGLRAHQQPHHDHGTPPIPGPPGGGGLSFLSLLFCGVPPPFGSFYPFGVFLCFSFPPPKLRSPPGAAAHDSHDGGGQPMMCVCQPPPPHKVPPHTP